MKMNSSQNVYSTRAVILKGNDIINYINAKHSCQEFSLAIGSLTPSKVLPLFDITEHKAVVCPVLLH